jgi:hypothetical protein
MTNVPLDPVGVSTYARNDKGGNSILYIIKQKKIAKMR